MEAESRWTRAQLVRRAAGGGAAVLLGGAGLRRFGDVDTLAARAATADTGEIRNFHSRPDLKPPALQALERSSSASDGLLFIAPSSGPGQRGVMIVDDTGEPIWFRPTGRPALNFRVGHYKGAPVLTWWEGSTENGLGEGTHVILDRSYREIARIPAGKGRPSDLHEFLITSHGTALITAWERATVDLRGVGGSSRGTAVGGLVQELELPSGKVLFEWRSLDHVAVEESYAKLGGPFDYFHINAIDVDEDGNLLVSARNTWAVYKIGRRSGEVIWRLGGKRSDFAMGPGTAFAWQHDARHHGYDRQISIFDNGAAPKVHSHSRGIVLALDTKRMQAKLHRVYMHRPALLARALGSMQILPNGNVLVGWGTEPYFTEYSAAGKVLLDMRLPDGGQNYRALRFPWRGQPVERPKLVARRAAGATTLYASWNGATDVAAWQLRTGTRSDALTPSKLQRKQGFETTLSTPAGPRYAAVVAVGRTGNHLATSVTVRI